MTTSENGIAFIKSHEGFAAFEYNDNGHAAIGYGHDLLPNESYPNGISIATAVSILQSDLTNRFEPPLNEYLTQHGITLTQNQFDAWIDFAYNLGTASAITMIAHGVDQVPVQMLRWNHINGQVSSGLTARRQAEVKLWNQ